MRTYAKSLALAFLVLPLVVACSSSPNHATPTAPTQTPGIDFFVGGWTSAPFNFSTTVNGTQTGCSQLDYTFTKQTPTSASVEYDLVCAGYSVKGVGSGELQGTVLAWNANGTVTNGTMTCPFVFTDNTATPQGNDILVKYNATVCGVGPFSGSMTLRRK